MVRLEDERLRIHLADPLLGECRRFQEPSRPLDPREIGRDRMCDRDARLEAHRGTFSRTSILPVTAAEMRAVREPGFEFVYDSGSGIQDVAVTALRLASRVTTGDRLTLEADTIGHPTAIYDLIARLDPAGRFHLYRVTQVELAASVITDISQPPQRVTIRLTRPNACSLPYDDLGLTLRAMLHASGIEPKAPADAEAPAG